MARSLSNLVSNLSERIRKIKCKYGHNDKKYENCWVTYKVCDCFLKYKSFKDDLIEDKCLCCNKNYEQKLDEKLKERVFNVYKFSNNDNNKFILLLGKGVFPYKYMDDWEKSMEYYYLKKKIFAVT